MPLGELGPRRKLDPGDLLDMDVLLLLGDELALGVGHVPDVQGPQLLHVPDEGDARPAGPPEGLLQHQQGHVLYLDHHDRSNTDGV